MSLNLTELKDEPLGKHPSQAAVSSCPVLSRLLPARAGARALSPPTTSRCFTFDVDGLSDEALEAPHAVLDRSCHVLCVRYGLVQIT